LGRKNAKIAEPKSAQRRGPWIRFIGAALILISSLALAAPLTAGKWSLQFLSLFPLAVGVIDLYTTIRTPLLRARPAAYATGILAIAAALILYLSPSLIVSGVVTLLLGFLTLDGVLKLGQSVFPSTSSRSRMVTAANGASSLALALIGWLLWKNLGVNAAIGVAVAGYTATAGWRMLVSPALEKGEAETWSSNAHPDPKLGLREHVLFGDINKERSASAPALWRAELYWLLVIAVVLLATHVARMQSSETWLGLISPFVATAGDVFMAIALGALLVLPARLFWRWLTRPVERKAWQLRFSGQETDMDAVPRRIVQGWTNARFSFSAALREARSSLPTAAELAIRLGLPLAILFVAVNPIWGFSWYFNTESWASAFYQKVTEIRVDPWRARMADAVASTCGGWNGELFRVTPPGIDEGDFSFLVIGDPGEGDASQYSLIERYLELGRRDDIKFLVISSDVIYPAGAMVDYEKNFYLPFKGFTKPIYAIPGNHDWFDALEGFNANFLKDKAARVALSARADADLNLTSTDKDRINHLLKRAQELRNLYGIRNDEQRAPYFDIQTEDFALIAVDTGILRSVDDRQRAWLADVLKQAKGKFIMVIVGHPKYAAGVDTSVGDASFAELYDRLERAGARVLMAGDTHDFEFYIEEPAGDESPRYYFVNGGGGAYLSIGSALEWPATPPTNKWAFYPSSDAVTVKLDAETPTWKQPFWLWIKRFGAWPISIETLSGMFDFNHAPFYQSFVEVRVERSNNKVIFALHGANGPISWRDLQVSSEEAVGEAPDDPVEFTIEMQPMP
jgi:uncharacterized membrane protein HdeD (DUF308 family)